MLSTIQYIHTICFSYKLIYLTNHHDFGTEHSSYIMAGSSARVQWCL